MFQSLLPIPLTIILTMAFPPVYSSGFGQTQSPVVLAPALAGCSWTTTCESRNMWTVQNDPEMTLFGRKTGVRAKKNVIFSGDFSVLRAFLQCKPLIARNLRKSGPSKKNRA
jgi:hypothetical protein